MKNHLNYYEQQYREMMVENLRLLVPIGILFVTGFSYIDYRLNPEQDFKYFFLIRFISCIPMMIFYYFSNKLSNILETFCIIAFCSVVLGASLSSYLIGGLSSDYYIVILIISFIQLSFFPLDIKKTAILESMYVLIFFPINILPFEHDTPIVLKQLFNYLSFSTLKFISSQKAREMLEISFAKKILEQEMQSKDKIQVIFGELCHLINNPLFISQSLTKRILKNEVLDESIHLDLNNSLDAQKRIQQVVSKLTELYENKEIDLEEYQLLLEKTKNEIKNFNIS